MSANGRKEFIFGLYLIEPARDFLVDGICIRGVASREENSWRVNGFARQRAKTLRHVVAYRYIEV